MVDYDLCSGEKFAVATDHSGADHLVKVQEQTWLSRLMGRWKITTEHEYRIKGIDVSLAKILKCIEKLDLNEHVHVMAEIKEKYGYQEVKAAGDAVWNRHINQIETSILEEGLSPDPKANLFKALGKMKERHISRYLLIAALDQLTNDDLIKIKGANQYADSTGKVIDILVKRNGKKVRDAAERGNVDELIKLLKEVAASPVYNSDIGKEWAKDIVDHFKGDIGQFYDRLSELDLVTRLEVVFFIKENCSKEKVYQNKEAWNRLVRGIEGDIAPNVNLSEDPLDRILKVIDAYFSDALVSDVLVGDVFFSDALVSTSIRLETYMELVLDDLPSNKLMFLFEKLDKKEFSDYRDKVFKGRVKEAVRSNDIAFIAKYLEVTVPELRQFPNGYNGAAQAFIAHASSFHFKLFKLNIEHKASEIISSLASSCHFVSLNKLLDDTSRVDRASIKKMTPKVSQYKECPQLNDSSIEWPTAINDSRKKGFADAIYLSSDFDVQKASENWDKCETIARQKAIEHRGKRKIDFVALIHGFDRALRRGLLCSLGGQQPGVFRDCDAYNSYGDHYMPSQYVPQAMKDFNLWLNQMCKKCDEGEMSPIEFAALAYQRLVSIHPYEDANDITSRVLMDYILMRYHIPPASLGKDINFSIYSTGCKRSASPARAVEQVVSGLNTTIGLLEREAPHES